MRASCRIGSALAVVVVLAATGCGPPSNGDVPVPGRPGRDKSAATERATRRAYDGAPPTIPHLGFDSNCTNCHTVTGMAVEGIGFAPPSPHENTAGLSLIANCRQCHVLKTVDDVVVASNFIGVAQDLRRGATAYDGAPPVMPHPAFMRENCKACHTGLAAREEIRTPHPERIRCRQCHVERVTERASLWP